MPSRGQSCALSPSRSPSSQVRVTVSISIGIATTPSRDTLFDLDDLIREADSAAAMYYAKSQGSGSWRVVRRQAA